MKWLRKAADQGLARAQCLLGLSYTNGEGVKQDKTEGPAGCAGLLTRGSLRPNSIWACATPTGMVCPRMPSKPWPGIARRPTRACRMPNANSATATWKGPACRRTFRKE